LADWLLNIAFLVSHILIDESLKIPKDEIIPLFIELLLKTPVTKVPPTTLTHPDPKVAIPCIGPPLLNEAKSKITVADGADSCCQLLEPLINVIIPEARIDPLLSELLANKKSPDPSPIE
jgi:hypothetical protein